MPSHAVDLTGTLWAATAQRQGLDPALLYAVAVQETQRPSGPGAVSPWPWTLRSKTGPHFYETQDSAVADLQAMTRDTGDVDVGLLQVNLKRHGHRVGDPATLLDARINLMVATEVLAEAIRSAVDDLALGIGRYRHPIDDTLAGLVERLGLTGNERFTPALQDRMAMHLARDAGLQAWLTGALSDERFAANLARVWAGFPGDRSDRSVYAGIQGNRATIGWRAVVDSLRDIRFDGTREP
jgi:hypothetical protein